jgi:acylphosphatase
MNEAPMRLCARVYGRVHGVNFRYYTQREAGMRGLTGWVANRSDSSVEIVAEGEKQALHRFLTFLYRGSPSARVDRVQTNWEEATGEFDRFRVRYSY